ncbi:response regulator [Flocculibacter collagenilyticus]|uniref:response regulator n=1 Tax=Flocculibacter collagenilyticus TaxID=2744479 RepID=UPI0018F2BA3A|nr:response regulator [Flocculibacter collagenilyticus]
MLIHYIDDDPDDQYLIKRAISTISTTISILCFDDANAYLEYIQPEQLDSTTTPDLVLLDINMPMINGFELLSLLKNSTKLNHVPVYIYTTSQSNDDAVAARELGAKDVVVKPSGLQQAINTIKCLYEQHSRK